jgi:hypothetical protein
MRKEVAETAMLIMDNEKQRAAWGKGVCKLDIRHLAFVCPG